ncbi:MAG: carbohydrate ABC transporter permease [Nocardioidaceae bacterium]
MAKRARNPQAILPRWLAISTIAGLLVLVLTPVAYMVLMSVSPDVEAVSGGVVPSSFKIGNYVLMWQTVPLASALFNSLFASLTAGLISIVLGLGAAYCLTRFDFPGRATFLSSLVALQSLPQVLLILPIFVLFSSVGLALGTPIVGTRFGLILTYLTFALPFSTWLMVTYLRQIPQTFEEAALIDGLSRVGALRRIILPLALPGMVVALVFALLLGWNDVLFASVLTAPDTKTVAVELGSFASTTEGGAVPLYGQLMAASLTSAVPVVALYMIFQRQLVGGLTAGGDKG